MKHLKNKGFTLIELVVAITILGIILLLALPRLSDLKNSNRTKKYEKYAESLMTSAKLYTDSYSKDMFGNNESGCYDIPYSKLEGKHLAKDIKVDGATCDTYASDGKTPLTYVKVLKSNQNYSYQVAIKCLDQHGNTVYEKKVIGAGICDGTKADEEGPTIVITPDSHDWYNGKKSGKPDKVTIKISDLYGVLENATIEYAWIKSGESSVTYKTKDFKNKRGAGTLNAPLTTTVEVPQGKTGIYQLVIKSDKVRDINGNYPSVTTITSGEFKLDNTPPTISNIENSKDGIWTNSSVTISASATDAHSGIKKVYYTYSNSNAASGLQEDWNTIIPNNQNLLISKTWTTDRNSDVYLIAVDNAGNQSAIVSAGKIKIDKTPPTIPIRGSIGNVSGSNATGTIQTKASGSTDSGSGLKEYRYLVNNTGTAPANTNSGFTTSRQFQRACGASYYAYAIAIDVVGNRSTVKSLGKTSDGANTYSSWSSCSAKCNGGTQTRTNSCALITTGLSQECNTQLCCSKTTTTWGNYGACNKTCGGGTQKKTGTIKSAYDGSTCGTTSSSRECNTQACYNANDCKIRGNTEVQTNTKWQCTAGHWHTKAYIHYCTDKNGKLYNKNTNENLVTFRYVCPSTPPNDYTVIDDPTWSLNNFDF